MNNLLRRRGVMTTRSKPYIELEAISNPNGGAINTNLLIDSEYFYIEILHERPNSNQMLFGNKTSISDYDASADGLNYYYFNRVTAGTSSNDLYFYVGQTRFSDMGYQTVIPTEEPLLFTSEISSGVMSSQLVFEDGTVKSIINQEYTSSIIRDNSIMLFRGTATAYTSYTMTGKINKCQLAIRRGVTARYFIPAQLISSISASQSSLDMPHEVGEIGLWDLVEQRFYRDSDGIDFVAHYK